ncbi:hypothetical protein F2P81_011374 [Scophthalmus maximus]|uniref:Uncharacterized protein n=1 Tax=Scophthalmus maximus TaxID=52904 RepID=A0A6A4T1E3_SCOMX|nr:hypothetical protein F2P81_011374 [Scophthalmus maximus]
MKSMANQGQEETSEQREKRREKVKVKERTMAYEAEERGEAAGIDMFFWQLLPRFKLFSCQLNSGRIRSHRDESGRITCYCYKQSP